MALSSDIGDHAGGRRPSLGPVRWVLLLLVGIHIAACCVSLYCVALIYPEYHIFYRRGPCTLVLSIVAAFALVGLVFVSPISALATLSDSISTRWCSAISG